MLHNTVQPPSTRHETKGEAKALEMSLRGGRSVKGRGFSWDLLAVPLLLSATSRGDVVLWFRFQARCLRRSALHSAGLAAAGLSF